MGQTARPTVLLINPDTEERGRIEKLLASMDFVVRCAADGREALGITYDDPPGCVVVSAAFGADGSLPFLDELKTDNIYGHLPVLLLIDGADLHRGFDWMQVQADDFVTRPFSPEEFASRLRLMVARNLRSVGANPLSGLPGNPTIMIETDKRLAKGAPFAFAYLDLDGFKAFNDRYGFGRGDEVLRMTARLLLNTIHSLESRETYVGHVGGDDFVFITPSNLVARVCEQFVREFDAIIPNFYDDADRQQGGIQSLDRQGNPLRFAIMTCSIGVVDTGSTQVAHAAELFSRVADVKTYTKKLPGSNYLIDRRK
ncbi:MAG: diguanylate cyclase [Candidatus Hydrogenedentes bacterium]|nr:diguanylate cyclase [Candidatus Hydrogenedentota bacterium]